MEHLCTLNAEGKEAEALDAGVAVLDGIGLLFGIIPGVIAFAVDFSNGTIYLPEELNWVFWILRISKK